MKYLLEQSLAILSVILTYLHNDSVQIAGLQHLQSLKHPEQSYI